MTRYSGKMPKKPVLGTPTILLAHRCISLFYFVGAFLVYETDAVIFFCWILIGLTQFALSFEE